MNKRILVIDIETTGFLKDGGHIVEVGIVELDLENGNRKVLFDKVTHEKGITKEEVENSWIVANSDLTVDEIRHSVRLDKLLPEIQEIINKYPLGATAFNRSFDMNFLKNRGVQFKKLVSCPMLMSTAVCKIPSTHRNGGYKWPKVQEAYDHFFPDNDYVEEHRGCDDAMHEAEIVYELYKLGIIEVD